MFLSYRHQASLNQIFPKIWDMKHLKYDIKYILQHIKTYIIWQANLSSVRNVELADTDG